MDPRPYTWRQLADLATGRRRHLVQQASLVWTDRGAEAIEQFIESGSFDPRGPDAEPYSQALVKAIVSGGKP